MKYNIGDKLLWHNEYGVYLVIDIKNSTGEYSLRQLWTKTVAKSSKIYEFYQESDYVDRFSQFISDEEFSLILFTS